MEENNNIVNNEDIEVLDDQSPEEVSSGNSFNVAIAAGIAAGIGGAILLTRKIVKKIKSKKAQQAETGDNPAETEEPKKVRKGLKLGRDRELVIIDHRSNPEKKDSDEK